MISCDVAVIGGGPAGLTAAIRLAGMGLRVVLVHRAPRRRNPGEHLSFGVARILDFIGCPAILQVAAARRVDAMNVAWRGASVESAPANGASAGWIVDRSVFDAGLLVAARQSGVAVHEGQVAASARDAGGWKLLVREAGGGLREWAARQVLQATGRDESTARCSTHERLLAMEGTFAIGGARTEVAVEALADGWMWGAQVAPDEYRVMLYADPRAVGGSRRASIRSRLEVALSASQLFGALPADRVQPGNAWNATPYFDRSWRGDRWWRIGDAALAVDPVSGTGVEKSMRLALQVAVAVNTLLVDADGEPLAHEFIDRILAETAEDHAGWSSRQYEAAWCAGESFWKQRSPPRAREAPRASSPTAMDALLSGVPAVSASVRFMDMPCAVGNRVERRQAVDHPSLARPIAFVSSCEFAPLVRAVRGCGSFPALVDRWSPLLGRQQAVDVCAWAIRAGLIEAAASG